MTNEQAIERLMGILTEAIEFENSVCYVTEEDREPLEMAIEALNNQKTGHWIATDMDIYECSECHKGLALFEKENYCPHCGAKMEGE